MKKSLSLRLYRVLSKRIGAVCILLLIQSCAQSPSYAPWLTEKEITNSSGLEGMPSLLEFRGAEAPLASNVPVPPYPNSRLFKVELHATATEGPFRKVCPEMRGLILVSRDIDRMVLDWYSDHLENPRIINSGPKETTVLWGKFAQHNWGPSAEGQFAKKVPHIAIHALQDERLAVMLAPFKTAIDVMYCD